MSQIRLINGSCQGFGFEEASHIEYEILGEQILFFTPFFLIFHIAYLKYGNICAPTKSIRAHFALTKKLCALFALLKKYKNVFSNENATLYSRISHFDLQLTTYLTLFNVY